MPQIFDDSNRTEDKIVKQYSSLSESQIEQVERICEALEKRFNAEAEMESQQKIRILFQRAAKEWLPFIIYCLTFAPVAGVSVWRIAEIGGLMQIVAWIGLILVMVIPVWFVPRFHRPLKGQEKSEEDPKYNKS